ncbi:MAG: hypothetical protein ACXVP5_09775, partial [Tumebacillaceae bacterium]
MSDINDALGINEETEEAEYVEKYVKESEAVPTNLIATTITWCGWIVLAVGVIAGFTMGNVKVPEFPEYANDPTAFLSLRTATKDAFSWAAALPIMG